jgi:hypothetical protein
MVGMMVRDRGPSFIEGDLIPLRQPAVFILKRHLLMMLHLVAIVATTPG